MTARLQGWIYRNIWAPQGVAERAVNLENPKVPINGWTLDQVLGGNTSSSGRAISYDSSLTLSAVWRATSLLSGILSTFPFQLFEKTSKGRRLVPAADHNLAALCAGRINNKMTKVVFFDRSMQHFLLWGNHIALPFFNGIGRVERIEIIHPKKVTPIETATDVVYKIEGIESPVLSENILHVPNMGCDIWGKSVLSAAREDLSMQMDARDYGTGFYSKGGVPTGIFLPEMHATNEQRQELQKNWDTMRAKRKDVAMPFGWKYQQLSIPPEDAALIATAQFGITTVARWFGVPPQKLADLGRATYNNVESMGIEFLQDTMAPIAKKFEVEYTTKLLTLPSERDMYLEFNMDAYLRADSVAKAEALTKLVQNGLRTPNEGRELDNYNNLEGGDDLFMQSGTMPIRMIQQLLLSKQPAQRKSMLKQIEKELNEGISPQLIIEGLFQNGNGHRFRN